MIDIVDAPSVYGAFQSACAHFAAKPFLCVPPQVAQHYAIEAGEISYAEMQQRVAPLIARYANAGYGSGHRVALMLDNRPEFFAHWFALNALGASVVPINVELNAAEQAYLLALSEVALMLAHPTYSANAEAALAELAAPIALDILGESATAPTAPSSARIETISIRSECAILFTSGSTGRAKACVLDNDYFLSMGRWYRDLGGLCALEYGTERLLTPLPLSHMNAMATSLMAMLATGGCLIQLDRFHASTWWQTVHDTRPSVIHYLGVMPAILLQLEETAVEVNPSIKFAFGAGVNPAHHAKFEQRFGFPLIEAWAMTETGAGGCIAANREPRHVGRSCFGKADRKRLEYRLVDEADKNVALGQAGELLIRAAGADPRKAFFREYFANPSATAEAWADGWWHTGDVVCELDDGSLCFVDRRKNIIRRSGENIAALEVEAVLSRHPSIKTLAVTPAPDEIRGEEVMALIVLDDGFDGDAALARAIFDHCESELAYYKLPAYIVFADVLPLTATQKPKRNEIKLLAKQLIDGDGMSANIHDLRGLKRKLKA